MSRILGVAGYLLLLLGLILMNFSPLFGFLSVVGFVLVAIAWMSLGEKSGEKVMVGNGAIMFFVLILSFTFPLISILTGNLNVLSYGILFVMLVTLASLFFDLLSHLKAYLKFKSFGFAVAFFLRLLSLAFSIYLFYSMRFIFEMKSLRDVLILEKSLPQITVFGVVVILANLFSALGFYGIREK